MTPTISQARLVMTTDAGWLAGVSFLSGGQGNIVVIFTAQRHTHRGHTHRDTLTEARTCTCKDVMMEAGHWTGVGEGGEGKQTCSEATDAAAEAGAVAAGVEEMAVTKEGMACASTSLGRHAPGPAPHPKSMCPLTQFCSCNKQAM